MSDKKQSELVVIEGDEHDARNRQLLESARVPKQNTAIVRSGPDGILDTINNMVEKEMPAEAVERLFGVYERMADRQREQEFFEAFAAFKRDCPPVPRRTINGQFKVASRNGGMEHRRYASLEDIGATVREPLGRHGLSYHWEDAKVENGYLTVVCVVDHAGGHSQKSAMTLPIDSKAGCSDQQKIGAAQTYAQRYSLIQALGLTTCDEDTDGADLGGNAGEPVTEQQANDLRALLMETGRDERRFLQWLGVDSFEQIPARKYGEAMAKLEQARRAK